MKTKSTAAVAALIVATIGFTAIAPAAYAQNLGAPHGAQQGRPGEAGKGFRAGREFGHHMQNRADRGGMHDGMRGGLLDLVCSERGAERLEIAFVRLAHRIELTAEQTDLFDELKTAALAAQTEFADTCTTTLGDQQAAERPDLVEGLKARLALDSARIAAMESVLPRIEAFFNSLTDEQKAALAPQRQHRGDMRPGDAPSAPAAEPAPQAPTEG